MKTLEIKWTISKALETYGYNRVSLYDGMKKYSCLGGGYDMLGTVFAYWLWANYKEKIIEKIKPDGEPNGFYGYYNRNGVQNIDGACGLDCMKAIAKEIGLEVKSLWSERKKETTHFIITEKQLAMKKIIHNKKPGQLTRHRRVLMNNLKISKTEI